LFASLSPIGSAAATTSPLRKRRLPLTGTSAAKRKRALGRVAAYLRNTALRQAGEPATLAVVAVDNAREIAPVMVSLAERCAQEGYKIVVADLVKDAPVARLLGANGTGMQSVRLGETSMVVFTPEDADLVQSGPLRPAGMAGAGLLAEPPSEAVESVAKKAKILLTVAELDPAIGGEHLSTWATQAVAVLTAGRTRAPRAYAVGEMLRLSGIRAVSGIIVGADKTDESLGSMPDEDAVLAGFRSEPVTPNGGQNGDGPTPDGDKPGAPLP
jgi:hypothetical protein